MRNPLDHVSASVKTLSQYVRWIIRRSAEIATYAGGANSLSSRIALKEVFYTSCGMVPAGNRC